MKNNFRWYFAIIVLIATGFSACKKESNSNGKPLSIGNPNALVTNNNGRLQFKNSQALMQTLEQLKNKQPSYWNSWETTYSFESLRNSADTAGRKQSFGFPDFYATVINDKGEYMIGDTVVWFNSGYKYLIPYKNEELLAQTKLNPSTNILRFKAGNSVIYNSAATANVNKSAVKNLSTNLNSGQIDAWYQYTFHKDDNYSSVRKLIFEIQNYVEANSFAYVCYIHTRIKQEYLAGGTTWKPAGETVQKSITGLNFSIAFSNTGNGTTSYATGSGIDVGPQIDGYNLDYVMCTFQASRSNVTASVNGNYYAKVLAPNNSQGVYSVNATW